MKREAAIEIVYLPISEIKAYENNPRNNERAVDEIVKSFTNFGVRSPAIVDKDNVIIAGHTRIKAAIKMGMTEFPCVRAEDLSKSQAKALRLADNRVQEDSEWDTATLAAEFEELKNNGYDLLNTGFDSFEIESINFDFDPEATAEAESEADFGEESEYDPEDVEENSEEAPAAPLPPQADDGEFTCIVCCHTEEERMFVNELIGETEELRSRYTVKEIREMLGERA